MDPIRITLAGKEYAVEPLKMRPARAFREKLGKQVSGLTDLIAGALAPTGEASTAGDLAEIAGLIGEVGRAVSAQLIGSTDVVADLLFEFSPALAADRERIENEAYDEEIVAAFVEVLKTLYPFGGALNFLNGQMARRT